MLLAGAFSLSIPVLAGGDSGKLVTTISASSLVTDVENAFDGNLNTVATFTGTGPAITPSVNLAFEDPSTISSVTINFGDDEDEPNGGYIFVYATNEIGQATTFLAQEELSYEQGGSQVISISNTGKYVGCKIEMSFFSAYSLKVSEITVEGTCYPTGGDTGGDQGGDTSTEAEDTLTVKGLEMSDILNAENLFDGNMDTYAEVIITNDLNNRAIFSFEKLTDLTTMTLHYGTATINLNEGDSINILLHGLADGVIDDLVSTKYVEGETQTITIDQKGKTYKRFQLVIVTTGSINLQIKEIVFNGTLSEDSGDDYGGGPGPGRREELTLEELYCTRMISPALAFDRDNSTSAQFIVGSGNHSELAVLFKEGKAQIDEVAIDFATATSEVSDAASTKITIYGINLEGTNINCTELTSVDYEASLSQIIGGMNNKDKFDGCKIVISSNGDAKIYVTELSIRGILEDSGGSGGDQGELIAPTSYTAKNVIDIKNSFDDNSETYGEFTGDADSISSVDCEFEGQTSLTRIDLAYTSSYFDSAGPMINIYGEDETSNFVMITSVNLDNSEPKQMIRINMDGKTYKKFRIEIPFVCISSVAINEIDFYGTITKDSGDTDGISTISTTDKAAQRYSLDGRRVDSNYKGIVIENGKKIFVK